MITGPDPAHLLAGPVPEQMATTLISASSFYCPYPVLWALLLLSFGLGIYIGYRRYASWKYLYLRILDHLTYRA